MLSRRALLAAIALPFALDGCGWTPLYADAATGPADADLRAVRVAPISERIGQKLAIALRDSLNPDGEPTPQRYVLSMTLQVLRLDLGVQTTGIGTRGRLEVYAYWTLLGPGNSYLLSVTSHANESFDILANNYSNIVTEDDARTRAIEELRRDIVTRLTVYFQRRAATAAAKP